MTSAKICSSKKRSIRHMTELNDQQHEQLAKSQQEALTPFIGSFKSSRQFDPAQLDDDLAKISAFKKER